MPTNTKKVLEDDYYSNVNKPENKSEDTKKQKKIVIKKKPKIKKVIKKDGEVQEKTQAPKRKITLVKKSEQQAKQKEMTLEEKLKSRITRKSDENPSKKTQNKKTQNRKTTFDNSRKNNNSNSSSRKFNNRNSNNKNSTNANKENGESKITERGSKKKNNQNFGNKKTFQESKNSFKNSKKRKKKVFIKAKEEVGFTRAKKQDIKKQEKKIEDIEQHLVEKTGQTIILEDILSVKEFSEKTGIALPKLLMEFMKNGMPVNINSKIDFDTATIIAEAFEIKCKRDETSGLKVEDVLEGNLAELLCGENPEDLQERPPVISIMGHVDHGKTSLLDNIRKTKVTEGEAGGITQSIGAYQVEQNGKKITFLDTPGHEAFTIMRARGAKSTDIAILVVAADEGVKPQTIESINHAKEAGIPVIVAINKMDKTGANPDFVKGQLSEQGLTPEDWGGTTPMIPVSAKTGFGVDELLEMILLVAEMQELKANPNRLAIGTVIESHLDNALGPVATVLINTGTLKKQDPIVCKGSYGKVKVIKNFAGISIKEAYPSDPVLLVGLDEVVEGGDLVQVVGDIETARKKSQEYFEIMRNKKAASMSNLDMIMSKIKAGNLKTLKVIVKADSNGSLEALKGAITKLSTPETNVSVIHAGVGNVTESDIAMAEGSQAILIGFNVGETSTAKKIIDKTQIEYLNSKVIYHITERIEKIVTGMLDPKEETIILGEAKVGEIFYHGDDFMILGLILAQDSKIEVKCDVNIVRNGKLIGKGVVENLKSGTLDVKELEGPIECGIQLKTNVKVEPKDTLEFFKIVIVK